MTDRAVVSVATGEYYGKAQIRLGDAVRSLDPTIQQMFWNRIPHDWPDHSDKPYAFKAYAMMEASNHADVLLWCDSVVMPIQDMAPLWEKIERDGYWIPLNGWTNYQWTADSAYPDLFPNIDLETAREANKQCPHAVATCFGLDIRTEIGRKILLMYHYLARKTKCFRGPWANTNNPDNPFKYHESMMGACGPADVLGHRHDQTALSVIARTFGAKLTPCPEFFAYPPPSENTIIVANGGPIG